jgi:hypothetical protein
MPAGRTVTESLPSDSGGFGRPPAAPIGGIDLWQLVLSCFSIKTALSILLLLCSPGLRSTAMDNQKICWFAIALKCPEYGHWHFGFCP